jgi:Tfp pilus assembly protein PilX
MKTMNSANIHKGEKGIALLTALFSILLLSAIAFGMMYMATAETQINSNFRDSEQAYFAARSGIEEMRERMRAGSANTIANLAGFPTTSPTSTGGVFYLLNPSSAAAADAVQPWLTTNRFFDTELAHDNFYAAPLNPGTGVPGSSVPATTYYASANSLASSTTLDYKWVRITHKTNASQNDMANAVVAGTVYPRMVDQNRNGSAADFQAPVCFDENSTITMSANAPATYGKQVVLPNGESICVNHVVAGSTTQWQPVYTITSLAVTPTGARRILQAEVAKMVFPALPASLVLDGPLPNGNYNGLNSNAGGIKGIDQSAASPCLPGGGKPSIGTYDDPSIPNVNLTRPIDTNYTGVPDGVSNIGATGTGGLGPLGTVAGLQGLVSSIASIADSTGCAAGAVPACGPPYTTATYGTTSPMVTYAQGNFSLPNNSHGQGILVVTGDFVMGGNATWDGLIIVIGTGSYTQAGTSSVNGGVLVANINSGVVGQTPGSPYINFNGGGGSGGIFYDSCKSVNTNTTAPFRVLAVKEIPY